MYLRLIKDIRDSIKQKSVMNWESNCNLINLSLKLFDF